jgi:hypothetical protein
MEKNKGNIRDMIRTIRIWWLLRKLDKDCREHEALHHEHARETGHPYSSHGTEISFLEEVSKDDPDKMVLYRDFLRIADTEMHLLKVEQDHMPCADCGCLTGPNTRWIRLNEARLNFTGVFDLTEYILTKYKLTWGLIATIILSPVWVTLLTNYLFQPICQMVNWCHF